MHDLSSGTVEPELWDRSDGDAAFPLLRQRRQDGAIRAGLS
jgi:hypothetical protein